MCTLISILVQNGSITYGSPIIEGKGQRIHTGFQVGWNGEAVLHLQLQFVDDTILFSLTDWEEIATLKRILRCSDLASGLKINLSKSLLVWLGCPRELIQPLANRLGWIVGLVYFRFII